MKKTLLVGLDAACWEYLDPLLGMGRMPRLKSLISKGASGTVRSTMPPWTPTAWASIVTGKNPGKHGIFDMTWRRPGSYEFVPTNASLRVGTPFWVHLNRIGLRVGLVNIPFTHPPQPLDGFVVTGFGTPLDAKDVAYPHEILPWIQEKYGDYEPAVESKFLRTASPQEILEKETDHQRRQVQIAAELARLHQVDVLAINLMLTDHANHKMPDMDLVFEAYSRADADLGILIDEYAPDNVMLISDHGSSRLKGEFLLYDWLRDQGYYAPAATNTKERADALNWLLMQWLRKYGWSGRPENLLRSVIQRGFFSLPASIRARIWSRIEEDFPYAQEYVLWSRRPDYQHTKVFPSSAYAGLLYLNLEGRDASGVIAAGRRQEVLEEIETKLSQIKEPGSDRPLFSNIYRSEELYTGSFISDAPDLILDSYDAGWNIRTSRYSAMPERDHDGYFVEATNGRDFGWHSRDGIFVFCGPDFIEGHVGQLRALVDVPATLLYLCDVPIPEDYDGAVMQDALTHDSRQKPIRTQAGDKVESAPEGEAYSAEEAEQVMRHLEALGYLD